MLKAEPLIFLAVERAWLTRRRLEHGDLSVALIRIAHAFAWSADVPRRKLSAVEVRKQLIGRPRRRNGEKAPAVNAELAKAVWTHEFDPQTRHAGDVRALLIVPADIPRRVPG